MRSLHGLEPEQLARIGIFYLEEAVLDVLHEARHSEEWLSPSEISKAVGVTKAVSIRYKGHNYPLVRGILDKFDTEERVEPSTRESRKRQEWHLTEEEFERRCDDL